MTTIDFTPLYRSTIGFDRLPSLLESALRGDPANGYPHYNIEVVADDHYTITLAVAGFEEKELTIEINNGVLQVSGTRKARESAGNYLYQGIAKRSFERKFNLADHVKVTEANLENGLLTIDLVREIPEELKARKITIKAGGKLLSH